MNDLIEVNHKNHCSNSFDWQEEVDNQNLVRMDVTQIEIYLQTSREIKGDQFLLRSILSWNIRVFVWSSSFLACICVIWPLDVSHSIIAVCWFITTVIGSINFFFLKLLSLSDIMYTFKSYRWVNIFIGLSFVKASFSTNVSKYCLMYIPVESVSIALLDRFYILFNNLIWRTRFSEYNKKIRNRRSDSNVRDNRKGHKIKR
jgi:hypothetical protein